MRSLYRRMTGRGDFTPLQMLFQEITAIMPHAVEPARLRVWPPVHLRVWQTPEDGWRASWSISNAAVDGKGGTPEDAILQAHTNYVELRERAEIQKRLATKRRRTR